MNRMKSLKRSLGEKYVFEKFLTGREIRERLNQRPPFLTDTVAASLTVGCVKIELVIFKTYDALALGYDVFVKDKPDSPEWICYDNLSDPVCIKDRHMESEMFAALDRAVESYGLSYTECNFEIASGKPLRKHKTDL